MLTTTRTSQTFTAWPRSIAISHGHIFLDGNKRTAFQSMALFLGINGIALREDAELVEITVEAAQGRLNVEQAAEHLRRLTE
ncbi:MULTISPECIES: type II toxin-antitoxin system death-on-curing family toxin [Serratia]|uniref:type II toxin-antitoxin system death-on-curing family toxin n=1 Tax=Serratia TaxID=613 RepID=UPI0032046F85